MSLENIRELRRAQRVLVSNQYSCNLEIEELRSLVQFYLRYIASGVETVHNKTRHFVTVGTELAIFVDVTDVMD